MEELSKGLIDLAQFILGVAGFVVTLCLIYLGKKIIRKMLEED